MRRWVVLTSSDLTNIETGLAVQGELGDRRDSVTTFLRLFDRNLSATVQKTFGFREVTIDRRVGPHPGSSLRRSG